MKSIVGAHLVGEAPAEEDIERNTDLIVLRLDSIRIACRLRKASYYERYGHQFTLRSDRPNGAKTELAKLVAGWGDYIFYGFADDAEGITAWTLGDLVVFREWLWRETLRRHGLPGEKRPNRDGSSSFYAYNIAELPGEFIVACYPKRRIAA